MSPFTRTFRPYALYLRELAWRTIIGRLDPPAYEFYARMIAAGCDPSATIDVLPLQKIIYISVPKAASSRVKICLSQFLNLHITTSEAANNRKRSGLKAPHHIGLSKFYRLAIDPKTLRFSFVRNPYARLVSCWADKFYNKPLSPGDPFVNLYLHWRPQIDAQFPAGANQKLSFADFARFAAMTASRGINAHWQTQHQLIDAPGLQLDFIGKVESFDQDFARVYEHVGETIRGAHSLIRPTPHRPWHTYYTPALAGMIYRTYERDFDQFHYPSALPTG